MLYPDVLSVPPLYLKNDTHVELAKANVIIVDVQHTEEVVSWLAKKFPRRLHRLSHLKRVRSSTKYDNAVEILVTFADEADETIISKSFENAFKTINFITEYRFIPAILPKTQRQWEACNKCWPCIWRNNELLASSMGTNKSLSVGEKEKMYKYMLETEKLRQGVSETSSINAAIIVDPRTGEVVGSGVDHGVYNRKKFNKTQCPLDHAVLNAIRSVSIRNPNSYYLCTGLHCYSLWEPCYMCAMSLVHARVGKLTFAYSNGHGNAFTRKDNFRLHGLSVLNHHFSIYRLNINSNFTKHYSRKFNSETENYYSIFWTSILIKDNIWYILSFVENLFKESLVPVKGKRSRRISTTYLDHIVRGLPVHRLNLKYETSESDIERFMEGTDIEGRDFLHDLNNMEKQHKVSSGSISTDLWDGMFNNSALYTTTFSRSESMTEEELRIRLLESGMKLKIDENAKSRSSVPFPVGSSEDFKSRLRKWRRARKEEKKVKGVKSRSASKAKIELEPMQFPKILSRITDGPSLNRQSTYPQKQLFTGDNEETKEELQESFDEEFSLYGGQE